MPNITGVTETKLSEQSVQNTDMLFYTFYHADSQTNAGRVGVYIADNLNDVTTRPEFKFELDIVESCWVQIDGGWGSNELTIVGCIYRHPTYNLTEFTDQLNNIIKSIDPNKYHVYLCGDFRLSSCTLTPNSI